MIMLFEFDDFFIIVVYLLSFTSSQTITKFVDLLCSLSFVGISHSVSLIDKRPGSFHFQLGTMT